MIEFLEESAEQELKRTDHLIYVTLKYTRTTDVIKNIIKRLISAFDFAVLEALGKLKIKPSENARVRVKQLLEKKKDFKEDLDLYYKLKMIDSSPYISKEEYRKNVALIVEDLEIDINKLKEFFEKTRAFVTKVEDL